MSPLPVLIGLDEFQSAIPWQVALRQSLLPLHRLVTILNNPPCRTMIFQRTVTTPLIWCLTFGVQSSFPFPCPSLSKPERCHPAILSRAGIRSGHRIVKWLSASRQ